MKTFFLFALLFSSAFTSAQTIRNIGLVSDHYDNLLVKSAGMDMRDFQRDLAVEGLLPVHRFNTSYLQGIGEFMEFKKSFHYAPGASDIPDETTPLRYLLTVINRYQKGKAKVAFLYYDAVGPVGGEQPMTIDTSTITFPQDPWKPAQQEEKKPPGDNQGVRCWYLSSSQLASVLTNFTYKELNELEALNRRQLKVNELGADRMPRSSRQPPLPTAADSSGVVAAEELRQALLPDNILELLKADSINAVIVIPYGAIGQIPFQLLPLNDSTHFIDKYAFTISPHLCNFNNIVRDNPGKTGKANKLVTTQPLIVGNPQFFSTDSLQLPNLPGAKAEAIAVASLLGTTALIEDKASYDNILHRLKTSDFAYFATHAVPSFEDPANKSFLALTPSRNSRTGFLSIAQIQKTVSRKNKLAILSACQTGVGKVYKNGYCNIGRGFFIAGVDNSIISLWNLDDQNIVAFMTILVAELKKPQYFYPAENLRQATLRYKNEVNSNPAYWSAMVNFGVCY